MRGSAPHGPEIAIRIARAGPAPESARSHDATPPPPTREPHTRPQAGP